MSITCGLCNQEIGYNETGFHLSGKCRTLPKAVDIAAIITDDYERHGPISLAIQRIVERVLDRRLNYLRRAP